MGLAGFYVPISQVRTVDGLLVLYYDEAGLAQLKVLQWKPHARSCMPPPPTRSTTAKYLKREFSIRPQPVI